jgi:outer membrane protein insertion porin family
VLLGLGTHVGAAAQSTGVEAPADTLIARVEIEGHESVSRREVRRALDLRSGDAFSVAHAREGADSLLALLVTRGRPFGRVEMTWVDSPDGLLVSVEIDEGPDARLAGVLLTGADKKDRAGLRRQVEFGPGDVLSLTALEDDIHSILDWYAARGHPFATVAPGISVVREAPTLELSIDENLATRFEQVYLSGNDLTRDDVIVRETGIVQGAPYDARILDAVSRRLERLRIFSEVLDPVVVVDPVTGGASVGIVVSERPVNSISGLLGYAPDPDGGGEFTGLVDMRLGNIAGTGRKAAASWERLQSRHERITFRYEEPWIFGAPINAGVRGEQAIRDTLYTTMEADLFVSARFGPRTTVTWSVGSERYIPGGAGESTTEGYRTAVEAEYDLLDDALNPSRGARVQGGLEYRDQEVRDTEGRYRTGRLAIDCDLVIPTREAQAILLRVELTGMASTRDEIPFHEQITLGGANSLRGYREEQFRGSRVALGTVEYRFLLGRMSRAIVFVDAGYFYRQSPGFAKGTKLGYGIGLRGETGLGIIAIDYGLGEGDSLLDGKLHVGLIREF